MTAVAERLPKLEASIEQAVQAVKADAGASPVLAAVVKEMEKKLGKARPIIQSGDAAKIREAVVEVEQAADSPRPRLRQTVARRKRRAPPLSARTIASAS
jgi:hypothetical protein